MGLLQEESAKAAFREAMKHDPSLRLKKGEQPDRVVRVFDAARTGKTKSVMERPTGAPKKTGIGAGAIAAIVAGVALAGGAAVAAGTTSAPTPTTTLVSASPTPVATPVATPEPVPPTLNVDLNAVFFVDPCHQGLVSEAGFNPGSSNAKVVRAVFSLHGCGTDCRQTLSREGEQVDPLHFRVIYEVSEGQYPGRGARYYATARATLNDGATVIGTSRELIFSGGRDCAVTCECK